jgi:NAD(P)-dependent dehydrogenase (short-subunit alcohol dehydrogenase family)
MHTHVVLITGSSSGFGYLTAQTLARKGYSVYAAMRDIDGRNVAPSEQLRTLAKKENLSLEVVELDVTKDESVTFGVRTVIDRAGKIDVLVNNAGVMYSGVTEAYTLEQAYQQFEPNFFGVMRMNRAVLPYMRQQKNGLLIHLGSLASGLMFPFYGLYCASKHAVEALALSYRYDLSSFGIDSVIVEPGPFATNLLGTNDPPRDQECLTAYGSITDMPTKITQNIEATLQDPQMVVDSIAHLIEQPAGERPFRTVPGADFGLRPVNTAKEVAQQGLLEALGLQELEPLKMHAHNSL